MKVLVAIIGSVFAICAAEAQISSQSPDGPAGAQAAAVNKPRDEAAEERKVEDHISQLRQQLKITAAEAPQWDSVAKTMRENAEDIDRVIDKRESGMKTATAVEDLNSYADVAQAHALAVKRLADAFSALYSEMSDSQKKTADEIFSHRHHARSAAKS
jgi:hypothetical protein